MLLATGSIQSSRVWAKWNEATCCPNCREKAVHWDHFWTCGVGTHPPGDVLLRRFLWPRSRADFPLIHSFMEYIKKYLNCQCTAGQCLAAQVHALLRCHKGLSSTSGQEATQKGRAAGRNHQGRQNTGLGCHCESEWLIGWQKLVYLTANSRKVFLQSNHYPMSRSHCLSAFLAKKLQYPNLDSRKLSVFKEGYPSHAHLGKTKPLES